MEARADGFFRHDNDGLLEFLVSSLSSAMNISARLFPEAGGDLMSRYCSPRFCIRALLHRPHAQRVGRVELPSWA